MTDPMSMREFGEIFVKDLITFENRVVEINDDTVHIEMHYCPLLSAWKKLGFSDENCALFCDINSCASSERSLRRNPCLSRVFCGEPRFSFNED